MGDYVDQNGIGRNFTPDQLDRVADRLENSPKGPSKRVYGYKSNFDGKVTYLNHPIEEMIEELEDLRTLRDNL